MCYHLPFPESNNRIRIEPAELTKFCFLLRPSVTLGFTRYRILANVAAITDDGFKVGLEAKGCTYNVSNVDRAVVVVHPNHDKSRTEPTITRRSGFIMQRLAFAIRYAALMGAVFVEQRARILPSSSAIKCCLWGTMTRALLPSHPLVPPLCLACQGGYHQYPL